MIIFRPRARELGGRGGRGCAFTGNSPLAPREERAALARPFLEERFSRWISAGAAAAALATVIDL